MKNLLFINVEFIHIFKVIELVSSGILLNYMKKLTKINEKKIFHRYVDKFKDHKKRYAVAIHYN